MSGGRLGVVLAGLLAGLFCPTSFAVETPPARNLILHFNGSSEDENLFEWIKLLFEADFQRSEPVVHRVYPATRAEGEEPLDLDWSSKLMEIDAYPRSENVILDVVLRYSQDPHQWVKDGRYPEGVSRLMEDAAAEVRIAVEDFKRLYPDGRVTAFAYCVGGEVLWRAIEKGMDQADQLFFCAPSLIRDETTFSRVLLEHGYSEANVKVVTAVEDEHAPSWLKGGAGAAFVLIERQKD